MQIKEIMLGSLLVLIASAACSDTIEMGAVVLDDRTSLPMSDVEVCFSFKEDVGWRVWTESSKHHKLYTMTDTMGCCKASGQSNCGMAGCYVKNPPDGYYHPMQGWKKQFTAKNLFGVWQPDNLVATIRLQRVEHPIPLLVKYVRLADSKNGFGGESWTNCTFRYDLMKGDWLPPFGKGETGDLEINSRFELTGRTKMFMPQERKYGEAIYYTFHNTVSAASKDDRLEEVTLDPRSGIRIRCVEQKLSKNSLCFRIGEKKRFANNDKDYSGDRINDCEGDAAYVFRIRTQYDEKGRIKSAHYGKVYGKFQFQGNETVGLKSIEFLYYLNPTPLDRNLEWDMKTNLCPGKRQSVQKRP